MGDKPVPTALEFIRQEQFYSVTSGDEYDITQAMVEFAKLHCQEQARVISEKAKTEKWYPSPFLDPKIIVDKSSIINAYDLNNIK